MQFPNLNARRVQLRWRSTEFGSHRVVAAVALLLDAAKIQLVTGVQAGDATDGQQHNQGMGHLGGIFQPACDAGDVVIADEGQRRKAVEEFVVPLHRQSSS